MTLCLWFAQFAVLKIQKIWIALDDDESTLMAALRSTFPMLGDQPFQLCTIDCNKNITILPRNLWTTKGFRMQSPRSALYVLPKVEYVT